MDLFLINFKCKKSNIDNKKFQSVISKEIAEKILFNFYNRGGKLLHNADGSPYFEGNNQINISISHSKEIIAILFDMKKTGIDIEFMKDRNFENILKYFKINVSNVDKETFYKIWTDYEARYKAKEGNTISFIYKNYMCSYCISDNHSQRVLANVYEMDYPNFEIKKVGIDMLKPIEEAEVRLSVR